MDIGIKCHHSGLFSFVLQNHSPLAGRKSDLIFVSNVLVLKGVYMPEIRLALRENIKSSSKPPFFS